MAQLLLLRHAKSAWDDPSLPDHRRPLNARGERAARAMASCFAQLSLAPDLALVSSATRARQTFEALNLVPEAVELDLTDVLYLADSDALLARLRAVSEQTGCVLVVAHNPGLYELALDLVGDDPAARPDPPVMRLLDGYPTASLAVFTVDGSWSGLGHGRGRLTRFHRAEDFDRGAAADQP